MWYLMNFILPCLLVGQIQGHGRLLEPPSRSSMWRFGYNTPSNYNDNELFCGGLYLVLQNLNPKKIQTLCGAQHPQVSLINGEGFLYCQVFTGEVGRNHTSIDSMFVHTSIWVGKKDSGTSSIEGFIRRAI
ncbi:chitin-binding type-4 domain-containing protein, partial [Nephila pilipes]